MKEKTVESGTRRILSAFESGRHLTVLSMQRVGATTEGRKIVSRLRRRGHTIKSYQRDGENFFHYYLEKPNK